MRKVLTFIVVAIVCFGCEPQIIYFNAQPTSVGAGPANITLNWKISVGDGELSADMPVSPSLNPPQKVNTQDSRVESVCKTTTFKLALPYGGERTVKVNVSQPCACAPQTLTFTGTCLSSSQGPSYITQKASANLAPGNLKNLQSDADFPISVSHLGFVIAVGAGGGIIGPVPVVPAAGDYTISVPGVIGQKVCADATGPLGGGQADAPVVHLQVIPVCP
jgi:hypothetical protein